MTGCHWVSDQKGQLCGTAALALFAAHNVVRVDAYRLLLPATAWSCRLCRLLLLLLLLLCVGPALRCCARLCCHCCCFVGLRKESLDLSCGPAHIYT
jgi:hypothetical protein